MIVARTLYIVLYFSTENSFVDSGEDRELTDKISAMDSKNLRYESYHMTIGTILKNGCRPAWVW